MSCLRLCDCDDCYESGNTQKIYHIDHDTETFLREHCNYWFKASFDDICVGCIENINMDYDEFFVYDDYNLCINDKYLKAPELLKG